MTTVRPTGLEGHPHRRPGSSAAATSWPRSRPPGTARPGPAAARTGTGTVVVVTGEPGIGKTRLVETAVALSGARVRWGRCTDVGGAPAWWPWLQVLGAVPEAGSGFAVGLAVVRELAALAADRPLLVVLDDVQWADADFSSGPRGRAHHAAAARDAARAAVPGGGHRRAGHRPAAGPGRAHAGVGGCGSAG